MNVQRLVKLMQHLANVPAKGFNMKSWVLSNGEVDVNATAKELQKAHEAKYKCGMAACLGGHAAIVFPKLLKLKNGFLYKYDTDDSNDFAIHGTDVFAKVMDICYDHSSLLTRDNAPHHTPKLAIAALSKFIVNNPSCKYGLECNNILNDDY